jgi:hypothetical protein
MGAAWGLGRKGENGRGPSGRGADNGARSTVAPVRGRGGSGAVNGELGREESVRERERELGEGAWAFIERGRGEGVGEERPAFNAINGVVSLH